jgi:hypothetical protein
LVECFNPNTIPGGGLFQSMQLAEAVTLTPETQQSLFTAAGTSNFSQQRAFGPWKGGLT